MLLLKKFKRDVYYVVKDLFNNKRVNRLRLLLFKIILKFKLVNGIQMFKACKEPFCLHRDFKIGFVIEAGFGLKWEHPSSY